MLGSFQTQCLSTSYVQQPKVDSRRLFHYILLILDLHSHSNGFHGHTNTHTHVPPDLHSAIKISSTTGNNAANGCLGAFLPSTNDPEPKARHLNNVQNLTWTRYVIKQAMQWEILHRYVHVLELSSERKRNIQGQVSHSFFSHYPKQLLLGIVGLLHINQQIHMEFRAVINKKQLSRVWSMLSYI